MPKSHFCMKKKEFVGQNFNLFFLKCQKVRPIFEFVSQSVPKVQKNKVFWINVNFSKIESAVISDRKKDNAPWSEALTE